MSKNKSRERLYVLKGHIGLVGCDDTALLSFVLPWFGKGELAYLNLTFTKEEMELNSPEQFIAVLEYKLRHMRMSWREYVQEHDKKSNAATNKVLPSKKSLL